MKKLAAALLTAGLLIGGCAGDSGPDPDANPKEALISAFENLSKSEGLEVTLSLEATTETLNALGGSEGGGLTDEDADKILGSSVHVLAKGQGKDAQMEMVVTVAGEEDVTVKVVDQVFYFQADAEGLAETFGGDPADLQTTAQQAEAQGLDFVRPALEGEWIAITGAQELAEQFGAPPLEEAEASRQQFIDDITQALKDSAEVTNAGDDDIGTKLAVSLPIRDIYSRVVEAFQRNPATAAFPFAQLPPASEIPDESVVVDVWVDDDRVTQVAFDLAQIAALEEGGEEGGGRAAFVVQLEEFDDDIAAPEDSVEVTAQELFQIFGGMAPGLGAGGTGTGAAPGAGFDCKQLQGAPPAVIAQFAEECPELQP